jgi:hypothetical protein
MTNQARGQSWYLIRSASTDQSCSLTEVTHDDTTDSEAGVISSLGARRDSPSSIAKPVRPTEFSLWVALPFVNVFVLLAVALGVIYGKAYANGTSEITHYLVFP